MPVFQPALKGLKNHAKTLGDQFTGRYVRTCSFIHQSMVDSDVPIIIYREACERMSGSWCLFDVRCTPSISDEDAVEGQKHYQMQRQIVEEHSHKNFTTIGHYLWDFEYSNRAMDFVPVGETAEELGLRYYQTFARAHDFAIDVRGYFVPVKREHICEEGTYSKDEEEKCRKAKTKLEAESSLGKTELSLSFQRASFGSFYIEFSPETIKKNKECQDALSGVIANMILCISDADMIARYSPFEYDRDGDTGFMHSSSVRDMMVNKRKLIDAFRVLVNYESDFLGRVIK